MIGTDGRASLVRKRAGLELRLLNESYDVLWFKLPLPEALEGINPIQIFASGANAVLAYRSWDRRWQLAWLLPKGGWRGARERDWLAECAALLPAPLGEHLLSHRDALVGPSCSMSWLTFADAVPCIRPAIASSGSATRTRQRKFAESRPVRIIAW